jgi:hypothetical protein
VGDARKHHFGICPRVVQPFAFQYNAHIAAVAQQTGALRILDLNMRFGVNCHRDRPASNDCHFCDGNKSWKVR